MTAKLTVIDLLQPPFQPIEINMPFLPGTQRLPQLSNSLITVIFRFVGCHIRCLKHFRCLLITRPSLFFLGGKDRFHDRRMSLSQQGRAGSGVVMNCASNPNR